ncbi:MAG: peptidoglycan-binding domain-containing protein [Candidatus Omnitrophota bacterium]
MSRKSVIVVVALITIFLLSSVVMAMGRKVVKPAEGQPASLGTTQPEVELIKPEQLEPNAPITEEMKEKTPQEIAVQLAPDENTKNKQVQTALKNAGYDPGAIDGKLGQKSKKAIKDFQTANGFKADGKVGPKTWSKLSTYLSLNANDSNAAKGGN